MHMNLEAGFVINNRKFWWLGTNMFVAAYACVHGWNSSGGIAKILNDVICSNSRIGYGDLMLKFMPHWWVLMENDSMCEVCGQKSME